mgnify:FL=1
MTDTKPLRVQFSKDIDKSTEHLIQLAQSRRQDIELWDVSRLGNARCILTVGKHGDVNEVMAPPMKVSMKDLIADSAVNKGPKALATALRFAQAYDL